MIQIQYINNYLSYVQVFWREEREIMSYART